MAPLNFCAVPRCSARMDKTQLITAFTAIISLGIGALLQHVLGGHAEARKQRELLRASAYADFLRGVSSRQAAPALSAAQEAETARLGKKK